MVTIAVGGKALCQVAVADTLKQELVAAIRVMHDLGPPRRDDDHRRQRTRRHQPVAPDNWCYRHDHQLAVGDQQLFAVEATQCTRATRTTQLQTQCHIS